MGILDAFGDLVSGIIAAIVMLGFAILSLFVTVSVVDAAAAIGGLEVSDDFVLLGASVLAAAAIISGGIGFSAPTEN
jgi:hypothetical protein